MTLYQYIHSFFTPAQALMCVPLLALVGALLSYTIGSLHKNTHIFAGIVATAAAVCSFLLGWTLFVDLREIVAHNPTDAIESYAWTWFRLGELQIDLALRFDNLAAVMTLIVTGVGSLIHLYAIGYMAEDSCRPRFFAYLNLFLFAMLLLVLGNNLLVMFVGWEGVGLCSYLLIGFWFKEMPNAKAGQKAFVVNRIGDAGFLLGMFLLAISVKTLNFISLEDAAASLSPELITAVTLLLFVGAVGKSAQLPLFVWLPDAMAGPTPVSALIHAATMVTAGIYMVTRMYFLYELAPYTLLVIAIVGTLTAFVAASIALVQNDIKKVLAYSTVSQLGYMFMALGAGAFSNGIFHVVTHAFFKACLFMAAGSVIIGCHHEQDMRKFGGLWNKMPWTFISYLIATLAIAGFPTTSGFYSKDAILWTVFSNPGLPSSIMIGGISLAHILWGFGVVTAFMTAFYMTRSLMMTFFGSYRGHAHPHENSVIVWSPLIVLGALSWLYSMFWGEKLIHFLLTWTRADMQVGHHVLAENEVYSMLEVLSAFIAVSGIATGVLFYSRYARVPVLLANTFRSLYRFLCDKWRFDELYDAIVVRPLLATARGLFYAVDRVLVDGTVNATAGVVAITGETLRAIQPGRISFYLLSLLVGNVVLLGVIFWFVNIGN